METLGEMDILSHSYIKIKIVPLPKHMISLHSPESLRLVVSFLGVVIIGICSTKTPCSRK